MKNVNEIINAINNTCPRSAWDRGVKAYALELLEDLADNIRLGYAPEDVLYTGLLHEWLLNGAQNWKQFSWGGSSLIYNGDIAARLCTPSELVKTRNGERRPNAHEDWLDCQARALYQAESLINRTIKA